jgi:hypothetical protein
LFGDGSSGAIVLNNPFTLIDGYDSTQQATDFTVASGTTLYVDSGAVIRCTGNFQNDGTIIVRTFAEGGSSHTSSIFPHDAGRGISPSVARNGYFDGNTNAYLGTIPGAPSTAGIPFRAATAILKPGSPGGGGGGSTQSVGGAGGGTFTVLAAGSINVGASGQINADGQSTPTQGGGGGGGVVILASRVGVTDAGSITCRGGAGGSSTDTSGPHGGGGGGIIHFLAPNIAAGATDVGGGAAGQIVGQVTNPFRGGGAAGGASKGLGGAGGSVPSGNPSTPTAAQAGNAGIVFQTVVSDPASLLSY